MPGVIQQNWGEAKGEALRSEMDMDHGVDTVNIPPLWNWPLAMAQQTPSILKAVGRL